MSTGRRASAISVPSAILPGDLQHDGFVMFAGHVGIDFDVAAAGQAVDVHVLRRAGMTAKTSV